MIRSTLQVDNRFLQHNRFFVCVTGKSYTHKYRILNTVEAVGNRSEVVVNTNTCIQYSRGEHIQDILLVFDRSTAWNRVCNLNRYKMLNKWMSVRAYNHK